MAADASAAALPIAPVVVGHVDSRPAAAAANTKKAGNGSPAGPLRRSPAAGGGGGRPAVEGSLYRTRLCKDVTPDGDASKCPYQHRCFFAHTQSELRTVEQNVADGLLTEEDVRDRQRADAKKRKKQRQSARRVATGRFQPPPHCDLVRLCGTADIPRPPPEVLAAVAAKRAAAGSRNSGGTTTATPTPNVTPTTHVRQASLDNGLLSGAPPARAVDAPPFVPGQPGRPHQHSPYGPPQARHSRVPSDALSTPGIIVGNCSVPPSYDESLTNAGARGAFGTPAMVARHRRNLSFGTDCSESIPPSPLVVRHSRDASSSFSRYTFESVESARTPEMGTAYGVGAAASSSLTDDPASLPLGSVRRTRPSAAAYEVR